MSEQGLSWVVIIEADGNQLPNWYYRRRDALAYRVRGDGMNMEQGPLARRGGGESSGVIFQEGCILCASESMARVMVHLTQQAFDDMENPQGHPVVTLRQLGPELTSFGMTRQDQQVLNRIDNVLGKKGRKPAPQLWTVSCTECGHATEIEHWSPVNCPNCGGFLIHNRPGHVVSFRDPGDLAHAELWLRTRFHGAHWEPADLIEHPDAPTPRPVNVADLGGKEANWVANLMGSPVMDAIGRMDRDTAVEFLDALFISRTYRTSETRLQNRLTVAMEYFKRGGSPTGISLVEPPQIDLVDAANVLSVEVVVDWLIALGAMQQ